MHGSYINYKLIANLSIYPSSQDEMLSTAEDNAMHKLTIATTIANNGMVNSQFRFHT